MNILAPTKFVPNEPWIRGGIKLVTPSLGVNFDKQSPYGRMWLGSSTNGIIPQGQPHNNKTLSETLFDTRSALKIKTAEVAMHLDTGWRELLFRQLDDLHADDEWDDRDQPTEVGSFVTFLRMILHIRPQKKPGIGLTNSGHLIAAWAHNKDRLTIECLPIDQLRWVLVRWIGEDRESAAGTISLLRLVDALAPYDPASWFGK